LGQIRFQRIPCKRSGRRRSAYARGQDWPYPWGSAKKPEWLETVKTHRSPERAWLAQQWQRRRANIYPVMAGVILLLVISGGAFDRPGPRPQATQRRRKLRPSSKPRSAELTLFESYD
jgi:hypothetical protein